MEMMLLGVGFGNSYLYLAELCFLTVLGYLDMFPIIPYMTMLLLKRCMLSLLTIIIKVHKPQKLLVH